MGDNVGDLVTLVGGLVGLLVEFIVNTLLDFCVDAVTAASLLLLL